MPTEDQPITIGWGVDPNGVRVFYGTYDPTNGGDLYSVRSAGSVPLRLNGPRVEGGAAGGSDTAWSADGTTVVYRSTEATGDVVELYSVRLVGDQHGDGVTAGCDCAPADGGAFAVPPEVAALRFDSRDDLAWPSQAPDAGSGTTYDVLRGVTSELPVGSGASETCLQSGVQGETWADTDMPAPGAAPYYYLVRAVNACGAGSYGTTSWHAERTSPACP